MGEFRLWIHLINLLVLRLLWTIVPIWILQISYWTNSQVSYKGHTLLLWHRRKFKIRMWIQWRLGNNTKWKLFTILCLIVIMIVKLEPIIRPKIDIYFSSIYYLPRVILLFLSMCAWVVVLESFFFRKFFI